MARLRYIVLLLACLFALSACGAKNTMNTVSSERTQLGNADGQQNNQSEETSPQQNSGEDITVDQNTGDIPLTEDNSTTSAFCSHPQFLVTVDSQPVWSVICNWYYANNSSRTCRDCGEWGLKTMCSQLSFEDCMKNLKNGGCDVILIPVSNAMAAELEGYVVRPILRDGIVFIRSNATDCVGFNLTDETIRLAFTAEETVFWDDENADPIIPASGWFDTEPSLWQHIEQLLGFSATSPNVIFAAENLNCMEAIGASDRTGSGLWPCYFNSVGGDVGIGKGEMISINGVYPTETSIADGSYPYAFTYCAIYSPGNIYTTEIEAFLVELQKNIQEVTA